MDKNINEALIKDFNNWVKKKLGVEKANYSCLGQAFNYLKERNASEVEVKFGEILPVLLKLRKNDDIRILVDFLRCTICKLDWNRESGQALDNAKTYLSKFIDYAENAHKRGILLSKLDETDIDEKEKEEYLNMVNKAKQNRVIISHDDLRKTFKNRLRCQDRTSGDKIWLPLKNKKKIYNPEAKKGKNYTNDFIEWLNSLVDNIYVHYSDDSDENKVKSAKFGNKKLYLEFIKNKNNEFDVNVILSKNGKKGKCFRALTPTGKGNCKEPMTVMKIGDIAIDHVKPIDQTLRDLELPFLKIVSDVYKTIQDDVNIKEDVLIKELSQWYFFLAGLKKDLYRIGEDGLLRLMASKYNSQKSNANTFQEIVKVKNKYYGIFEKEDVIKDDNENRVYYYQELTDNINGKCFRVTTNLNEFDKGTTIKEKDLLARIINKI